MRTEIIKRHRRGIDSEIHNGSQVKLVTIGGSTFEGKYELHQGLITIVNKHNHRFTFALEEIKDIYTIQEVNEDEKISR